METILMNEDTENHESKQSTEWLSPDEVASHLHVSRSTVYSFIRKGKIPTVHVGRQTRISRTKLDRLIESDVLGL